MKLILVNGPNLNLLGTREPDVYGVVTFDTFFKNLQIKYPQVKFEYYQSNIEGELINCLHAHGTISSGGTPADGIILNAGGYTHTSVALSDAIASIHSPVLEVHISNIFAREEYRHVSLLSKNCVGIISGLGLLSYELAVEWFLRRQEGI